MGAPEPSRTEIEGASVWLRKRGVRVDAPTTLLALRLGVRRGARRPGYWAGYVALTTLLMVGAIGFPLLALLPGVSFADLPESRLAFFMFALLQIGLWLQVRSADRRATAWLGDRRLDRPSPTWRDLLGGWYLASVAITFGGGAVLAVAMCVTTSKWIWAVLWLGLLALGAAVIAVILTGVVRRPVLAEDEASLAVDAAVRGDDLRLAVPSLFALPVLTDLLTTGHQPHEFTPWLIGYVVLAVGTEVVGRLTHRRRQKLPEGTYGTPMADTGTPVDWSPPQQTR